MTRAASTAFAALALATLPAAVGAPPAAAQGVACVGGFAGPYACDNVDLLAIVPSGEIVGGALNPSTGSDMWGWTDPETGREYAVQGLSDAVAFIDITDPTAPVFVGSLPSPATNFLWRDLKVYDDHAYIVGDFSPELEPIHDHDDDDEIEGSHGLQIFDLTRLRGAGPLEVFTEDALYDGFDEAHNFVIDEETGFAAAVATNTCNAEWHLLDLSVDPLAPVFLGCYDSGLPGAVHDAQCVVYRGPDAEHQGKEICLAFMEDQFAILDMSDPGAPQVLAGNLTYPGLGYVHQGVFTEDHAYVASNDELDELNATTAGSPHNTHTYMWDARDLDNPVFLGTYVGPTGSIDHNMYFNGNLLHQANYVAGYRVLDASDIASGSMEQIAFFDTFPPDVDPAAFGGVWSGYFHYESGVVALSQIDGGELFVLRPHLPDPDPDPDPGDGADKATGGGWLADAGGGKINFGFNAKQKADGPQGSLQLNDKGAGVKIHLDDVTLIRSVEGTCGGIVAGDNALELRGTGRLNQSAGASFRVCVEDNGEPGNSRSAPIPDRFHLECVAGCSYTTADRTADDAIDGGNLQVHRAAGGEAAGGAAPATLILDPLLLGDGQPGALQPFQIRAFDDAQEPLAGALVTLERTSAATAPEHFSALTSSAGLAVVTLPHLGRPAEYRAISGAVDSNAVAVQPLPDPR